MVSTGSAWGLEGSAWDLRVLHGVYGFSMVVEGSAWHGV